VDGFSPGLAGVGPLATASREAVGRGRPIRVLHVVGTMDRGGAESMLMEVLRRLDPKRVRCDVLAHGTRPGAYDPELARLGIPVRRLPSLGRLGYPRYLSTLAGFLRSEGPFDAVHSHLDWQGGAIAAAARLAGVRTVVVHSHAASWSRPRGLVESLHLAFCRLLVRSFATDAWACSPQAGAFLFDRRTIRSGRLRVVPNAIDLERFAPVGPAEIALRRARIGLPPDGLWLGHVGSLSAVKNQSFLLDLARRLADRGEAVRLVLVGEGPDRDVLSTRARALGLERQVLLAGSRADVPDVLAALDVFVFPSRSEGLGIAVVEAQAAGIPSIASIAVPPEADMGLDLLERRPLEAASWVAAVDRARGRRRHDREAIAAAITARGYDARRNAAEVAALWEAAVARDSGG